MTQFDVLQALDNLIQSRSILTHPFYVAWQRGELTRDQLATYARVYYPHVAAFPGYLSAAIEGTTDPAIRADLERNLADELTRPARHDELWLDFAEALGVERRDVASAAPARAAADTIETFTRLAHTDTSCALAALYAYESQQPEVSRQKREGLRLRYGVDAPSALAYFDVHAELDTEHGAGERASLARCLEAGASADAMLGAAAEALDAYSHLLDGVCEATGGGISNRTSAKTQTRRSL